MFPGLLQYLLWLAAHSPALRKTLPRPTIRVEVHAEAELDGLTRLLTLARSCHKFDGAGASTQGCPRVDRRFRGNSVSIEGVEPGLYLLGLQIGRERRVETVSVGTADRTEMIEFKRPRLRGRVTRNGAGVAATLVFSTKPEPAVDEILSSTPTTRESGPSGEYEANLWAGAAYVARVTAKEAGSVPATFRFVAPSADDSRDFPLTARPLHVRVRDADSGQPIEGALLVFIDPIGVQTPLSDAEGAIDIPSVAAGRFHATAVAKNYLNTVVDEVLEDRDDSSPLEISMKPRAEGNGFAVYRPDGSPAAGVFAYYRLDIATDSRVRIPCDADGICDPGERPGDAEWIILQHPDAGLTLRTAGEIYGSRSVVLAPAGGSLVIRLTPGGAAPDDCQRAIVSIGGVPVEPSASFTCGDRWPIEIPGLPAGEVEVTIVTFHVDDQARTILKTVAGPISVNLPSSPIEIPIP